MAIIFHDKILGRSGANPFHSGPNHTQIVWLSEGCRLVQNFTRMINAPLKIKMAFYSDWRSEIQDGIDKTGRKDPGILNSRGVLLHSLSAIALGVFVIYRKPEVRPVISQRLLFLAFLCIVNCKGNMPKINITPCGHFFFINVLILALENEFSEIKFGGNQNIFSTLFGTKFVICAAKKKKKKKKERKSVKK